MSIEENLRCAVLWALGYKCAFWTSIDRLTDVCERAEWLLERVGLNGLRHVPAGVLSYAEQQALENRRDDRRRRGVSARRGNAENEHRN